MRILLINMRSAEYRLDFQREQFEKLGLNFERIEAVTTQTLSHDHTEEYWQSWERPIQPTERACLLSHCKVWKMIAEQDQPALVLEDDAILSAQLNQILKAASSLSDTDHISLETFGRKKLISKTGYELIDQVHLVDLYQDRAGAAAYILWPEGARKLLRKCEKCPAIADAMINSCKSLRSYQTLPACAIQPDRCASQGLTSPIATTSLIGKNLKRTTASTPSQKLRRILTQLRLGFVRLSYLGRSRRIVIPIEVTDFPMLR